MDGESDNDSDNEQVRSASARKLLINDEEEEE